MNLWRENDWLGLIYWGKNARSLILSHSDNFKIPARPAASAKIQKFVSNMAEQVGEASNPQKSTFCQELLKVEKAFKSKSKAGKTRRVSNKLEQIDQIIKLCSSCSWDRIL